MINVKVCQQKNSGYSTVTKPRSVPPGYTSFFRIDVKIDKTRFLYEEKQQIKCNQNESSVTKCN